MTALIILNFVQMVLFLGFCVWYTRAKDAQVREMVRSILSRDAFEFSQSKAIEDAPKENTNDLFSDLVPLDNISDNEFDKAMKAAKS